ncbi:MAG: hypothetical protein KKD35_01455 [Elusimicrobia bacterium]|nr:hypothetical protein [Elusimicrobiota bacterium]
MNAEQKGQILKKKEKLLELLKRIYNETFDNKTKKQKKDFFKLLWVKEMYTLINEIRTPIAEKMGVDPSFIPQDKVCLFTLTPEKQKEFKETWKQFLKAMNLKTEKERKKISIPFYNRLEELRKEMREKIGIEEIERLTKKEMEKIELLTETLSKEIKIEALEAEIKRLRAEGKTPEEISKTTKRTEQEVIEILSRENTEIDVPAIELIHGIERQQDGYITLCRKINKEHQDLAGIKINELRECLPKLLPWLAKDAYFSVNASYRSHPWRKGVEGFPAGWRKEKNPPTLKYLNACYCDMDCYKAGLKWSSAVQIILQAQEENIIPPASIIARSGRGIYLLWLLTSERTGAQQRAFPQEIALYKQINKAIIERLDNYEPRLMPDRIAFDAARILRIPGSLNTEAETGQQQVNFIIQVITGNKVPVYTLKNLAEKFNISVQPLPYEPAIIYKRQIKNRGSAPGRRQGKIATGNYRISDLLTIAQNQGGFKQGKRWKSISYFCYFAKAAGFTLSDIEKQSQDLAEKCDPPYPSEPDDTPVLKIVKNIWVKYTPRFNNDLLSKFFKVTPKLADDLGLHSIIPACLSQERADKPSEQETLKHNRRELIKRIIRKRPGNIPSLRKLKKILENKGLKASVETINTDFKTAINELKNV